MSVGLLLVTHGTLGNELLSIADGILGRRPLRALAVGVNPDIDTVALTQRLETELDGLDEGDGVLVLTDLFGASPCNVISSMQTAHHIAIVTGVNLPMLMKLYNYPERSLADLPPLLIDSGRRCILQAPDPET